MCQRNSLTPEPVSPRTSTRDRTRFGQLGQRGIEYRDLVGGVVGVGPPGTQHRRQRLPGAAGAVIDERQHRMKPESPLEVRRRTFLLRVRPDQGGVQIDDHLPAAAIGQRAAATPPRGRPPAPARIAAITARRVITEGIDEPADRRIRGHRTEQLRLGPHQRRIGQAVTAQGDRDRQIQHRLARIMDRTRRPPRAPTPCDNSSSQSADLGSLQQQ